MRGDTALCCSELELDAKSTRGAWSWHWRRGHGWQPAHRDRAVQVESRERRMEMQMTCATRPCKLCDKYISGLMSSEANGSAQLLTCHSHRAAYKVATMA